MTRQDGFKRQPNSRHCFVCGLESPVGLKLRFSDNGIDEVRAVFTVNDVYQGYPGVVHGGVVAAMLDEAAGRTVMITDPNRFMMTAKIEIKYRQPVPTEQPLTLVGHLTKDRGRVAQAHGEVRLPDGSVAAEADLMLIEIPAKYVPGADWETLGWKVYPDSSQEDF
jgi:acyl-coenzyme A thioesterase PaaI-like protein